MGLAPYGRPQYAQLIMDNVIDIKDDGTFRVDMSYFNYATGLTMTNERFAHLFGGPARTAEALLDQREMDIAASIQQDTEKVLLKLRRTIHRELEADYLCVWREA